MEKPSNDNTDRRAIHLASYRVERDLGWIVREQATSDFGVDLQVEIREGGVGTGRLLALQVKGGPSWFKEPRNGGWAFRPTGRHVSYWTEHSLPVMVVLADLESEALYWNHADISTIERTKRGAWVLHIPATNTLANAAAEWRSAATARYPRAHEHYERNLQVLCPRVATILEGARKENQVGAESLAAHLANGRFAPGETVRVLMDGATPLWFSNLKASGFCAIASYAASHELVLEAADAYERAEDADESRPGRYAAAGALAAAREDPIRAQALLQRARDAGEEGIVLAIARLELGDADKLEAVRLNAQIEAAADDTNALMYRAHQLATNGCVAEAIDVLEKLIDFDTSNSDARVLLAGQYAIRSRSAARLPGDDHRAITLATHAVEDVRVWAGPASSALERLLQILIANGDYDGVLMHGLPAPAGLATLAEAGSRAVVVHVVLAAVNVNKLALARELVAGVGVGPDRTFLDALLMDNSDHDRFRETWLSVEDVVETPEQKFTVAARLATIGIDHTDTLAPMVNQGIVDHAYVELVKASALAVRDPKQAVRDLRATADRNVDAAIELVCLVEEYEDTATAAAEAQLRSASLGHPPRLEVEACRLLAASGDMETAASRISTVLTNNDELAPVVQTRAGLLALHIAASTEDWTLAESAADLILRANRVPQGRRTDIAWQLIEARLHTQARPAALRTLIDTGAVPQNPAQARLWAHLVAQEKFTEELAAQTLSYATRFSEDRALSGELLRRFILETCDEDEGRGMSDLRVAVDSAMRASAFAAIDRHVDRFGDASLFQRLTIDSIDTFIEQVADDLKRRSASITDTIESIDAGCLPAGVLASLTKKTYAFTLASRPLGYYSAGPLDAQVFDAEVAAASLAVDTTIVVEPSAILVAQLLGVFRKLRGMFVGLIAPQHSIDDIRSANHDLRVVSGDAGSLFWDPTTSKIIYTESDNNGIRAVVERLQMMEASLSNVTTAQVEEQVIFGPDTPSSFAPWTQPIELALNRQTALWSDDSVLRAIAAQRGVPSFSTGALLALVIDDEARKASGAGDLDTFLSLRRGEVEAALRGRVTEIPVEFEHLIEFAVGDESSPDLARHTVGRASWWVWSTEPVIELASILSAIGKSKSEHYLAWSALSARGIKSALHNDPEKSLLWIAATALIAADNLPPAIEAPRLLAAIGAETRHEVAEIAEHLVRAVGELDGSSCLSSLGTHLIAALTSPTS